MIHVTADTRYKLRINGRHVAIGPARSSPSCWYYDTLDIAKFLKVGSNDIHVLVVRYFAASRNAMPFVRTSYPGLTVIGSIEVNASCIDLSTGTNWTAQIDDSVQYPAGLIDDVFLHVRVQLQPRTGQVVKMRT